MKPLSVARYAFGYKRTLDHLKAWRCALPPEAREAQVHLSIRGKDHTGTRLFIHEHLPQLRYHNPHVNITAATHRETESWIKLLYEGGASDTISTTRLRQADIRDRLEEHVATRQSQ